MEEDKIDTTTPEAPAEEVAQVVDSSLEDCAKEIAAVLEKYDAKIEITNTILVNKK